MRIAKTLEARVAALEGDNARDGVAYELDLSSFDEVETDRITLAVGVLRSEGAHALTNEQLHLLLRGRRVAEEQVA